MSEVFTVYPRLKLKVFVNDIKIHIRGKSQVLWAALKVVCQLKRVWSKKQI